MPSADTTVSVSVSYEPGERCYAVVSFAFLGHFRADGRIIEKIDDEHYKVSCLIPVMMKDPQTVKRHIDHLAKLDDPDKWRRIG